MNYANFIGVFYGLFLVVQQALQIGASTEPEKMYIKK